MDSHTPRTFVERCLPPGSLWCDTQHDPDPTWCVEVVREALAGNSPRRQLTNLGYQDGLTGELRVVSVGRN